MAAMSPLAPLLVLSALFPLGSQAASPLSPAMHGSRGTANAGSGLTRVAPAVRPHGATSVPDGSGGQYVMWADPRDGDLDLFILRVTSAGTPALGWPSEGLTVCNAPGNQFEGALFSDGANGVIAGWIDSRDSAVEFDLYAQRINAAGVAQWTPNGVKVLDGSGSIDDPAAAPDGTGGLFVAWTQGDVPSDIYAVRFDHTGQVATGWDPGGEIVCQDPEDQGSVAVTGDGSGGAVFSWIDYRGFEQHVYAQRLDGSGAAQWAANGVRIDPVAEPANSPAVCAAGGGHTFVFWTSGGAAYGQRLDGLGQTQWAGPATLYPGGGNGLPDDELVAIGDGLGGAIVAWQAAGPGGRGVQAQRVGGGGGIQWGATGASVLSLPDGDTGSFDFVADGAGGAYFAWDDSRNGAYPEVYAQKVGATGSVGWAANGVAACTVFAGDRSLSGAALDGAGGLLVSWLDIRGLDIEVFTQRFTSIGTPLLPADGLASFSNPGSQVFPLVVQTADGGALVVWSEKRGGEYDIRARKVDPSGIGVGPTRTICDAPGHQTLAGFIADGAGGGIVAWWTDADSSDPNLFAQGIDGNASPLWTPNGVVVCAAPGLQFELDLASDGAGGAIFVWTDYRDPSTAEVFAQRMNGAGIALWGVDGKTLCVASSAITSPGLVADGAGGAIVAWGDLRVAGPGIYAQRLSADGTEQWGACGRLIGDFAGSLTLQQVAGVVPSASSGAIVLINETSFDFATFDIQHILHVQKLDASGAPQWGAQGTTVCDPASRVSISRIVDDGSNGAFVAWSDDRNGSDDVFAQHIDATGTANWDPDGEIVCDAASFQFLGDMTRFGADIILTWTDRRSGPADIYVQRVNGVGNGVWAADGIVVCDASHGQYVPAIAPWETATPERLYVAWTDNRASSERRAYLQRLDLAGQPQWQDDGITRTEAALASTDANAERVRLVWQATEGVAATIYRRAEDAAWIAVGTAFADGAGRISFEDRDVLPGARYGYRLGIVEAGGETFLGEVWVDVPGDLDLAIAGLRPHPAVRDLTVTFTLPRGDDARLEWLDLAGRRVRSQDLIGLSPGRHTIRLDGPLPASGVYVLRLTQGGRAATARAVVLK